jgi:hypothetical protein
MNSPLCDTLLAMYADLPSGGLAILYMACGASWFMIVAAAPRAVASARVTMPNARRCAPVFPSLLRITLTLRSWLLEMSEKVVSER